MILTFPISSGWWNSESKFTTFSLPNLESGNEK